MPCNGSGYEARGLKFEGEMVKRTDYLSCEDTVVHTDELYQEKGNKKGHA